MTRHLGMQVSAYVDRRLDARTLHAFDQHLVACLVCRYAVEEERRILTSLRSGPTPAVSAGLQSMLLALAEPSTRGRAAARPETLSPRPGARLGAGAGGTPAIPVAPEAVGQMRVRTVAPAAPALHRSPRRAAMVAGLAAGASAAAAIGLAVVGPGQGAAASVRPTVSRVPGPSSVTAAPAAFSGAGFSSSPLRQTLDRPGR